MIFSLLINACTCPLPDCTTRPYSTYSNQLLFLLCLGFRIDPQERLDAVMKEVQKLHTLFSTNPIFGVDFTLESEAPDIKQLLQPRVEEDVEVVDEQEDSHAVAAYFVEGADEEDHIADIVYDSRMGLAVEGMQEGITLELLWRVL